MPERDPAIPDDIVLDGEEPKEPVNVKPTEKPTQEPEEKNQEPVNEAPTDDSTLQGKEADIGQKHEPKEGSKRWDEIYWQNKENKRLLEDSTGQVSKLTEENKGLHDRLEALEDGVINNNIPDPMEDPKGYREFIKADVKRDIAKEQRQAQTPTHNNPVPQQAQIDTQIRDMEDKHSDYNTVIKSFEEEAKANPDVNYDFIYDSPNPAASAYAYKKGNQLGQKQRSRSQGYVEGGSMPPANNDNQTPTEEDIFMGKALGVDPQVWVDDRKAKEKRSK